MKNASGCVKFLGHEVIECRGDLECGITGVTNDSRAVKPGEIFVAINGAVSDGHKYICQAVENGASLVIYTDDCEFDEKVTAVRCRNGYHAYALCCSYFYDNPTQHMKLIGVTGTNGKTTSAFLMSALLDYCDVNSGLISTVVNRYGDTVIEASRTTPEPGELMQLFQQMKSSGCDHAVMEVSSHGLHQRRTGAETFDAAIFTNLTGDHLDYHGDMDSYFAAKSLLFTTYLADNGVAVVNIDDEYGCKLATLCDKNKLITFGKSVDADVSIIQMNTSLHGVSCELSYNDQSISLSTNLIGEYNGYNCVGVFCAAIGLGISLDTVCSFFSDKNEHCVPGRVESYLIDSGARVIVDYAHTDDALDNVLSTLRPLTPNQLITVFGCGGDRDRTKRPRMAQAVCRYSDSVYVTSDNPRTEDPKQIFDDILTGINSCVDYSLVPDRKTAIEQAISSAVENDCVLIAGKGHENYQIIGDEVIHFSDAECITPFMSE